MKKVIILIIFVLVMIEVIKTPYVSEWFDQIKTQVVNKASDTVGKSSLPLLQSDISDLKGAMSNVEFNYAVSHVTTFKEANKFKTTYCDTSSKLRHSVLTIDAIKLTCDILAKHLD